MCVHMVVFYQLINQKELTKCLRVRTAPGIPLLHKQRSAGFWSLYWTILGNAASVMRRTRYFIPPSDITSCFWFVWPAPRFGRQRSHLLKWTSLTVQSQQSSSYEESPLWSVWAASLSSFRNDWYFSRSSEVNIFSSSSESKCKRGKRGRAAELLLINSTESRVTLRHE